MPWAWRILGTRTAPFEVVVNILDSDSFIGDHPVASLLDGVTNNVRFEFRVPNYFRELISAYVVLVPGGTGNMDRGVSASWGRGCTEDYNTHTDSIVAGVVAVTANKLECIDVSDALDGVAAGDEVGLTFTRRGGQAVDTVDATVYVLKFVMQYV